MHYKCKSLSLIVLEILKLRFREKQSFEKISSNIDIPTEKLVDAFFDMAEYSDKVARL